MSSDSATNLIMRMDGRMDGREPRGKIICGRSISQSVGTAPRCELVIRGGQRPTQSPTYTHTSRVTAQGGASGLAARRAQPSSLAVSRLTVNAVKDLNGGASLGFLG